MRGWYHSIVVHPGHRAVRLAVALAVAPALALNPLSAEAILIHYDGYDIHTHRVVSNDVDSWVEPPEHQHATHDQDCQASGPHKHGGGDFLIVLDLPDVVLRVRGLGSGAVVAASSEASPSPAVVPAAAVSEDTPPPLHSSFFAPTLCPNRTVVGILLSNHALLL